MQYRIPKHVVICSQRNARDAFVSVCTAASCSDLKGCSVSKVYLKITGLCLRSLGSEEAGIVTMS